MYIKHREGFRATDDNRLPVGEISWMPSKSYHTELDMQQYHYNERLKTDIKKWAKTNRKRLAKEMFWIKHESFWKTLKIRFSLVLRMLGA